jgi:nitrogen fixation NifU-like protein
MNPNPPVKEVLDRDMKNEAPRAPSPEMSGPVLYYTEAVIDLFKNPRNIGEMDEEETDGYALSGDPLCGDQMKLWIKVEKKRIADIKFKSFGCPGAIATSSMVTHLARGRTLDEAMALTDDDVIEALGGIPENKKHCSLLGINALHTAIADYLQRLKTGRMRKPTGDT